MGTLDCRSSDDTQRSRGKEVSIVAQTGFQFDLSTPQGKVLAGVLSSISEFERDIIAERTKSGLKAAVARGKKLGRPTGNRTIDKHQKQVTELLAEGWSYRRIAERIGIGTATVVAIAKRQAG